MNEKNLDKSDRELKDEMVPRKGDPVRQEDSGGNEADRAGQFGEMKPEAAKALSQPLEHSED